MGLPVEIDDLLISSTAVSAYTVGKSLRFRSSASAYLSRTPGSASNRTTWTWSAWIKRGTLGTNQWVFGVNAGTTDSTYTDILFASSDTLAIQGYTQNWLLTNQVFRDPSAWYHIVLAVDTTQATAGNRVKLYVNGVQVTSFSQNNAPTQNLNLAINSTSSHTIGLSSGYQFDGYIAELNFIDGSQLTPSSFGAYDLNGVWQPAKYTGSYGTNGFYLPFSNTTSTTTLVADSSGNGNNWTPNNISLTAGSTYDSMVDSPTNSAASSNYCVLNPLDFQNANTYSNANLSVSLQAATASLAFGGMGVSSGQWYWEVQTTAGADPMLGVATQAGTLSSRYWTGANSVYYYGSSGNKYVAGTGSAYGASYTTTDVIGIALDLNGNTITYYKNNVSQGAISLPAGIIGQIIVPAFSSGTGTAVQSMNVNFGQRPFSYTPPTGYNALNTYNLPTPTIKNGALYNATSLYTGTNAILAIQNSQSNGGNNPLGSTFYPDLIWIKNRNVANSHLWWDSVRGILKTVSSDLTAAEQTETAGTGLNSFNTNGFTLGTDFSGTGSSNVSTRTYVAWQWNAGSGTSGSNTNGSITSTVSVNQTAGFSVVTYTGTGANATVGHGLGVAPSLIITKARSTTSGWPVYHASIGNTQYTYLNTTAAAAVDSTFWNNTSPTSTVISLGSAFGAYNWVAYCFAAVKGYSAFGSYTGNGSTDGPFVYLGFKPRFVMVKRTDSTSDWYIWDTSRDTYNVEAATLLADTSGAETSATSIDGLSNGFKCRSATVVNVSTGTYIYAAFAENPFNYSRAR